MASLLIMILTWLWFKHRPCPGTSQCCHLEFNYTTESLRHFTGSTEEAWIIWCLLLFVTVSCHCLLPLGGFLQICETPEWWYRRERAKRTSTSTDMLVKWMGETLIPCELSPLRASVDWRQRSEFNPMSWNFEPCWCEEQRLCEPWRWFPFRGSPGTNTH